MPGIKRIGLIAGAGLLVLLALAGAQTIYVTFASGLAEARKAYRAADTDLAIDRLTAATGSPFLLPHQKAEAYRLRGETFYVLKEDEKALADLSEAIRLAPSAASYRLRSSVHERGGQYDEAIADLTEALALAPSDMPSRLGRALLHESYLNHHAVIEDYGLIIEHYPAFASHARRKRGTAYAELGEIEKAISEIAAIPLDGSYDYQGHVGRGIEFDNIAAYDRAKQEFDAAIRLQPRNARALLARGVSGIAAGNFEGALRDLDAATGLDPDESFAHYGRGRANYHLGRMAVARKELEAALAANPSYIFPALWLHLVHLRTGGPQPAILQSHAESFGVTWPRPIFNHFIGALDREALFDKAAEGTPFVQREQLCEVHFFLGAALAARGDRRAKEPLEEARKICPRAFVEYSASLHELNRLAAGQR
ncbi:tetratricopeptide repeat protein [Parvibaculum sp.]|uniref:tetratricopeptide repeat protein n=1 Tax=Parvibaculum sp. TaxID=2024848 RepID=UPI00391A5843